MFVSYELDANGVSENAKQEKRALTLHSSVYFVMGKQRVLLLTAYGKMKRNSLMRFISRMCSEPSYTNVVAARHSFIISGVRSSFKH